MESKECKKCKYEKPLEEFNLDRSRKDNRYHSCRECMKLYNRGLPIPVNPEAIPKLGKFCTKCKVDKPLDQYHNNKNTKDGRNSECAECYNNRREKTPVITQTIEGHRICNKCEEEKLFEEFVRCEGCKYGVNTVCRSCTKAIRDTEESKEYRKEYSKRWYNELGLEYYREYYKEYYKDQDKRDWKIEYGRQYERERRAEDPIYKLKGNIRNLIKGTFKRACDGSYVKRSSTIDILGCELDFFVSYISEQFTEGMTLSNHGEWHLDHKVPVATAETEEDIIRLNHYTNFQPLWAEDNLRKGAKLDWERD